MNLKTRLAIYVTSRHKKFDFCLSCQPSKIMLPGSHLGLVHRLEDLIKSCPVGIDSVSSGMDNGLSTVFIKLDVEIRCEPESPPKK